MADNKNSKILSSKKNKGGKTIYKCPLTGFKGTKYQCIVNIEKNHPELIPEGYTAARLFFSVINKKDSGTCIICKNKTNWNEDTWRYDRLCNNPKCKAKYQEIMRKGMVNKYGKTTLLNDPNHQKKMLENRKISGEYKFKDGGIVKYVGSYEKNLLEYFDIKLNARSKDISSPGPTIVYKYKGKDKFWITDFYYIPLNLIIEVKDGGNNPNNRSMPDYRAKQLAKEEQLRKLGKFNYIRLTDNNFLELESIINEIKYNQDNNIKSNSHKILEDGGLAGIGATIGSNSVIMVNELIGNDIVNTGFGKDINNIYYIGKDGKPFKKSVKDITNDYITSITDDEDILESYNEFMSKEIQAVEEFDCDYLYKNICSIAVIVPNQALYDSRFESFIDEYKEILYDIRRSINTLKINPSMIVESLEILETNKDYDRVKNLSSIYPNIKILSHPYGVYGYNIENYTCTDLYENISDITEEALDILGGKNE